LWLLLIFFRLSSVHGNFPFKVASIGYNQCLVGHIQLRYISEINDSTSAYTGKGEAVLPRLAGDESFALMELIDQRKVSAICEIPVV